MSYEGNQGAEALVKAVSAVMGSQLPKERMIDGGVIKADYSLVTDSYPVPIPKGEWSLLSHLLQIPPGITPNARVAVCWLGGEAVVIGTIARI